MNLVVTLLAGGLGKRMNSDIPKVLHLFKGKPMLVHIIENSLLLNPSKIIIVTGKYDKLIQDTVKKYIDESLFNQLKYVVQTTPLGTGHAIKCCLDHYSTTDNVLILNGDTPKINQYLLEKFIHSSSDNSLLTCVLKNPHGYGRIITHNNNEILKIVEEKDATEEEKGVKLVNSGIYKIKGDDLKKYIPLIQNNNKQSEYYLTTLVELLIESNKKINSYIIPESENELILGVNTKEQLEDLEKM